MSMIMYGISSCYECRDANTELKEKHADFEYKDFSEDIYFLKDFLKLRDSRPEFDEVKRNGYAGVPCFYFEDGTILLDLKEAEKKLDIE